MKKKIRLFFCVLAMCSITTVYGQDFVQRAQYIFNFTKFIEWPGGIAGYFKIVVLDDKDVAASLDLIAKSKKVGNASVIVQVITSTTDIGNAHILYVPVTKRRQLSAINQSLAGKPTLIVSHGAASDFAINLINDGGNLKYQISKTNIESHKLKVNASLITTGIPVK